MEKLLQENVAPAIRASSAHLQTFTFTKVDMGQKPLRVLGVRAHPGSHKKQILLDLNISYVGDVQIDVEVKKFFCKAGVKGMQLHGMLRIILEPLLGDVPIVGALSMFFIRRPTLDINWTGMTNLLDIPGLSSMSDTMIMDTISSFLVLPNRLLVPLVPDLPEAAQLRCPLPRGVVRVHLRAARDLRCKDRFMGGLLEGRSDPYAVLRVGTQAATSSVIGDNNNPAWDEVYEFMVHEVPGQELEVELFDKDPDKDDLLGRMKLDLGEVLRARVMEEWFPLQDGGRGRLQLRLEWLSLLRDASKLDQVLERNKNVAAKPEPPSSAILVVYLDRAEGLPMKKSGKEPNPVVQVSVQDVTRESKVKDDPRQSPLGSLSLPLSRLLEAPELSLAERFPLQRSAPGARLHLKLELRVIVYDIPGQDIEFELFDKDIDKDDFLGRCKVPLSRVLSSRVIDEVLHTNRLLQPAHGAQLSAALLCVFLDRGSELPTCAPSTEPVWDEGFSFLVVRPHEEALELQVLVPQQVEERAASRAAQGREEEEEEEEMKEKEEGEDEEHAGLRQRLRPADSRPPPAQGPRLQLSLWHHGEQRKLVAIVHRCRELRAAKELPDPYVSLVLLPDRSRGTKRKTGVQRRSLNPEFNERFEWELSLEEAARRRLELTVKSTLSFVTREKEALGKLQLDLAQVDLSEGEPRW
ncbi:hypothetical protein DUI87_33256 [Hirundo rustica rustica]|uniref:Extended synaptotagmin-1 n=1 Tax=Hirundo rustica rustica TaxID=333673 RepID=A0A3M0IR95_HIRRU|nr:hypothetical protein DUI87_33256 [Hirundo rustica rustica]